MNKLKAFIGGLLLFITLFFSSAYFFPAVEYDNSRSRFYLLSAMVDYKQFNINPYANYTIDKASYNGNYFSNKSIGTSLIGVPVYGIARLILPKEYNYPINWPLRYAVTLITTSLSSAICGVFLWFLAISWGRDPFTSLLMVFGFSFGTIFWINATIFSGHALSATLLFIGFYILVRCKQLNSVGQDGGNLESTLMLWSLFAGFMVGLAGLCDYTAILLCPVIAIYVLAIEIRTRDKVLFFTGCAICAAVLFYYNWQCFGSPFSTGYHYVVGAELIDGHSRGFLGISVPDPTIMLKLLLSPSRGLLFIMPVLVFSLFGLKGLYKQRERRLEFWVIVGLVLGAFLINSGYHWWHGGWTLGPRYLVVMMPFLALTAAFTPLNNKYFYLLLAVSIFQIFPGVAFFPYAPEEIANPQFEIVFPLMNAGYAAFNLGHFFGLSNAGSIIIWAIIMLSLITVLVLFVRMVNKGNIKGDDENRGTKITNFQKLVCLLALIFIIFNFFIVRTDKEIVSINQKLLMDHYNYSPWRQAVSRDIINW